MKITKCQLKKVPLRENLIQSFLILKLTSLSEGHQMQAIRKTSSLLMEIIRLWISIASKRLVHLMRELKLSNILTNRVTSMETLKMIKVSSEKLLNPRVQTSRVLWLIWRISTLKCNKQNKNSKSQLKVNLSSFNSLTKALMKRRWKEVNLTITL